jgi:thymidylate synthase (FAD)
LVEFRSLSSVELIDSVGDDLRVVQAARVSVNSEDVEGAEGLIRFLVKNRHASPFEHVVFTWRVETPIFVAREFMRHRIASYNEMSGRYTKLEPVFYCPSELRPLQQFGKAGAYSFQEGTDVQYRSVVDNIRAVSVQAWQSYEAMLAEGVAKEVARMVLPVNIFTKFVVTMNARGLMNFLSLRTKSEFSLFESFPQYEIERVAEGMESAFREVTPRLYGAWDENGRVGL